MYVCVRNEQLVKHPVELLNYVVSHGWYRCLGLKNVRLPKNLENLSFGWSFNQPLEQIFWPSSLQSLTFGGAFNQSLENVEWPENLQSLTFGQEFDQSLESLGEIWWLILSEAFQKWVVLKLFRRNEFVSSSFFVGVNMYQACFWKGFIRKRKGPSGPEGLLRPSSLIAHLMEITPIAVAAA